MRAVIALLNGMVVFVRKNNEAFLQRLRTDMNPKIEVLAVLTYLTQGKKTPAPGDEAPKK